MNTSKPIVLCILDGWGEGEQRADNAILHAKTPFLDGLKAQAVRCSLSTSGLDVGLPEGQMGNSEVGHMSIGSGRIVMQYLPRIDQACKEDALRDHAAFQTTIKALKQQDKALHVMGLCSDGGVHAHIEHMLYVISLASSLGVRVYVHAFLDGRDTPPQSAKDYVGQLLHVIKGAEGAFLASFMGRYYAMDRDQRWERVEQAYDALYGKGEFSEDALASIQRSYDQGVSDEFIPPHVMKDYSGIEEGDAVFMANFRADRARELLQALVVPEFDGFRRKHHIQPSHCLGMAPYADFLDPYMDVLFPQEPLVNIFPEVLSREGRTQLRIAETEKYAHVTFFFSGGREALFEGEERILVPSPDVTTYDQQPEMSAYEVTDKLIAAVKKNQFDFMVVNYANGDMVGHTGSFEAAVKAAQTIDQVLSQLVPSVVEAGGAIFITADHGNAEQMLDTDTNQPHTAHTSNLVPFWGVGQVLEGKCLKNGRLCDIAPTLLQLMGIKQPKEMTGVSLFDE